jgi:hypothetical protein
LIDQQKKAFCSMRCISVIRKWIIKKRIKVWVKR